MTEHIELAWPAGTASNPHENTRSVGRFLVTTSSKSRYLIDLDRGTSTRFRGREPVDPFRAVELRCDGAEAPMAFVSCAVGASMLLVLDVRGDGTPTVRTTTPVELIEPLAAVPDDVD